MRRCDVVTGFGIVGLLWLCLAVGAWGKKTNPCTTKPNDKTLQHEIVLENVDWACSAFGIDAHYQAPVWLCRNKVTGARWMITILPESK